MHDLCILQLLLLDIYLTMNAISLMIYFSNVYNGLISKQINEMRVNLHFPRNQCYIGK